MNLIKKNSSSKSESWGSEQGGCQSLLYPRFEGLGGSKAQGQVVTSTYSLLGMWIRKEEPFSDCVPSHDQSETS